MLIIGIAGGTGCGKTTVVKQIIDELPKDTVGVISQDAYYNDLLHPRKVIIVEGILVLSNPKLRDLFDIKIFVHADSDERLIRRLQRDIKERGHDLEKVLHRYQTAVKPMHNQFIEPSKEFADIIIPNNHYNTVAVDMVRTIINDKLH